MDILFSVVVVLSGSFEFGEINVEQHLLEFAMKSIFFQSTQM